MKLYTLAFALIAASVMVIGDDMRNILWAAGMLLVSGLCIAAVEARTR